MKDLTKNLACNVNGNIFYNLTSSKILFDSKIFKDYVGLTFIRSCKIAKILYDIKILFKNKVL